MNNWKLMMFADHTTSIHPSGDIHFMCWVGPTMSMTHGYQWGSLRKWLHMHIECATVVLRPIMLYPIFCGSMWIMCWVNHVLSKAAWPLTRFQQQPTPDAWRANQHVISKLHEPTKENWHIDSNQTEFHFYMYRNSVDHNLKSNQSSYHICM